MSSEVETSPEPKRSTIPKGIWITHSVRNDRHIVGVMIAQHTAVTLAGIWLTASIPLGGHSQAQPAHSPLVNGYCVRKFSSIEAIREARAHRGAFGVL
jgi:hypothetical protein